ncbi:tRNA glutamyl-Q(34) synthetase GluQRS [uncultured Roseicyclus sp.]|uniref:tRNA glutamyl-Q(34) synthetase GluQRS n=1 Tax=uncultured Roseicyclus sp. TaxID=543072 RepID=UPI002612110E|nr:tRNA glutamyl-Q(34) synthetase GluQRS [uncultured Roseicyclus sp.]
MGFRTRFAPSPTGPLHLGHAYSAILAHDSARAAGGAFLLRIDDIDQSRARPIWEKQIHDDLAWLGLTWDGPPRRQSDHLADYRATLDGLAARGLTYPCRCTRRDIREAASAPQEGPAPVGPDGLVYPGTCRARPMTAAQGTDAIRLNMQAALAALPDLPAFTETGPDHPGQHPIDPARMTDAVGDVVLARPGMGASYHLSVVVDDAAQAISHVIRGADLFEATAIHVVLQRLLGLPSPIYHHHRLIRDAAGTRLAKRDDARAIATYRAEGATPQDIRRMVGL